MNHEGTLPFVLRNVVFIRHLRISIIFECIPSPSVGWDCYPQPSRAGGIAGGGIVIHQSRPHILDILQSPPRASRGATFTA
jgi:hypothetical protein